LEKPTNEVVLVLVGKKAAGGGDSRARLGQDLRPKQNLDNQKSNSFSPAWFVAGIRV
jgi:hypothetical protein